VARETPIPEHRVSRLWHLGRLVGGLAGGVLGEGVRQLAAGRRPSPADLLLTPANAARLADRLAEMRGAAMKVGQLLSMEAGDFLPPELTRILAVLREQAHAMPLGQVAAVLKGAWGENWSSGFRRFSFTPLAAASIGQVHEAETKDGRRLAIKIQYPGVRRSIDSDVDNVATLLRLFRILPEELDVQPLLAEAKRQLHEEADYLGEARHLRDYASRLGDDSAFALPEVDERLTTAEVLAMSFVPGNPIETLAEAPQATRDRVATQLWDLVLREFFAWGLVQTDPNFANYRHDPATGRIGLLDFGATRPYQRPWIDAFRRLLRAALAGDRTGIGAAATEVGYLGAGDDGAYREAVIDLIGIAAEPARAGVRFDFGTTDLARRVSEQVLVLRLDHRYGRLPPPDVLFLHRKLGGMYLLSQRLRARVDLAGLLSRHALA
jgi:predicted unusual protein kinase regulating ubiquinone biosynthesis (AarF/ABC1/UbiB family)